MCSFCGPSGLLAYQVRLLATLPHHIGIIHLPQRLQILTRCILPVPSPVQAPVWATWVGCCTCWYVKVFLDVFVIQAGFSSVLVWLLYFLQVFPCLVLEVLVP